MAPTTASVMAMRRPPRIVGSAAGISMVASSWRRVARRLRPSSTSRGSMERRPTVVATTIGKKQMRAQMSTLDSSPLPNQSTISGARARIGVAWAATM